MAILEADSHIKVPRAVGGAIKEIARQYPEAWRFICDDLCRARRLSYVPGNTDAQELMVWFEGRRFVAEQLQRIADAPMEDDEPRLPPARTMTERARRRASKPTTT